MGILFFPFVGPLDDAGEGDEGCAGKLGCPGQEKIYVKVVSV